MSFAQNLQFFMDWEGLTNYQLAKILECHQSSVKNWLDGAKPQKLMLKSIADHFGITVDCLLNADQSYPLFRLMQVLNTRGISIKKLCNAIPLTVEEVYLLFTKNPIQDARDCLQDIAKELNVAEAYLMGKTANQDDQGIYFNISEKAWKLANGDPYKAYEIQEAYDFEHDYDQEESKKLVTPEGDELSKEEFDIIMQYRAASDEMKAIMRKIAGIE